ncbi:VOC family protein [Streptomyces sp. NBC_01235]|uniref:VOC family protein n=1 Tax=Streptomyces sp. NBC_01235 TaxID=2903788 RepID=UPI002E1186E9|nr:VOC family protein [Streptomyces sp. NBC_01235]
MLRPQDQFHVGIVAENLAATTARLSQLFGLQWHDEMGAPVEVELPGGTAVLDFVCVYSKSTPRIEIVRPVPGTLWEPTPGSGIHHLGYWSDDVAADTAELERHGYEVEATHRGPDGAPFFAFLRGGEVTGFRVELVSSAARPALERLWAAE